MKKVDLALMTNVAHSEPLNADSRKVLEDIFAYFGREPASIDFFETHCFRTYRYGDHYNIRSISPAQNHFSSVIIFCETHYKTVSVRSNANTFEK